MIKARRLALAFGLLLAHSSALHAQNLSATRAAEVARAVGRADGWSGRAQLGAAVRGARDSRRPSASPSLVRRQPLLNRVDATVRAGVRPQSARAEMTRVVLRAEARYGRLSPLTPRDVRHYGAFLTEKAQTLQRYGRTPAQVTEGFVRAGGTVRGVRFEPRQVFVQRWRPVQPGRDGQMVPHTAPTGNVIVVSPGYLETGRDFYGQIDALTRAGHEVVVMDHQWGGYSDGEPGAVDRGYGVALYVAAVAAHADGIARTEYGDHPGRQVILTGTSMGAYAGVYGAMVLNAQPRGLVLDGPQMPRGLSAVLQAPFRAATPSATNRLFTVAARVPGLRNMRLPASGLPHLTDDHAAQGRFADVATAGDIRSRASAFQSTNDDLRAIADTDPRDLGLGRVYVIHSAGDTLANSAESRRLTDRLGENARLHVLPGRNHILSESPRDMQHLFEGIRWVAGAERGR